MKIATANYELEFPKYAKKIKTKVIPQSLEDQVQIHQILEKAQIKFNLDKNHIFKIYGQHIEIANKLKGILSSHLEIDEPEIHSIANRLRKDVHFRAILG